MTAPAGYKPIGPQYGVGQKNMAMRAAKQAHKTYGDLYIVRPIKAGKYIIGYQMYWKRLKR